MDKKNIAAISIGIIISFFAGFGLNSLLSSSYDDILSSELDNYENGEWLVNISGEKIGKDYLDKRVELYKKHLQTSNLHSDILLNDRILKKLIDNYIILKEVESSDLLSSNKAESYLWLFLEEAIVNYYLDFLISIKGNSTIKLTPKQIDDFYSKNKKLFDKGNIKKKDAEVIIKQELTNLNSSLNKRKKIVMRKMETGKLKKKKKIQINTELLKNEIRKKN